MNDFFKLFVAVLVILVIVHYLKALVPAIAPFVS